MKHMTTWPLTWLVQLWYIKIWPLTWLVQLWHITIWPLTWLVQPSQNPLACLYKPRVCGNKAELLRWNPFHVWLSLTRQGAGLADSRLTSPRDPSALLREVPLPLSFCGAPPAIEKARKFQKNIYFCFIDYAKAFGCVVPNKLWKILRDDQTTLPAS